MKKILSTTLVSVVALGLFLATNANSQSTTAITNSNSAVVATQITPWCRGFIHNHFFGSTDVSTSGEVSTLQSFLASQGFLTMPPGVSSGYFGSLTKNALARWQASVGISPASGFFGPLTRANIANRCINPPPPTRVLQINSLSPSSGPVGTWVTIQGSGLTSDSRIQFGQGTIYPITPACPANNCGSDTSLSFQIPESLGPNCTSGPCPTFATTLIRPGDYSVSVSNSNGTSNSVTFTVTSGSVSSNNPVISGVSAPTHLTVNQTGTWTVSASDPANGQLTYLVDWGDRYYLSPSSANQGIAANPQQTSTFTHSYSNSGTYTQSFTVRNESGGEARITTTVQVGVGGQTNVPHLNSLSPTSGQVGTRVYVYGAGLTSDSRVQFGQGSIQLYNSTPCTSSGQCGTTVYSFQVPQYLTPYCPSGSECPQYAIQVTAGTYPVSVVNSNGTSNTLYFRVGDLR